MQFLKHYNCSFALHSFRLSFDRSGGFPYAGLSPWGEVLLNAGSARKQPERGGKSISCAFREACARHLEADPAPAKGVKFSRLGELNEKFSRKV